MKRIYSRRDFKHYTMLKQILYDLNLADKDYLWLISDIEAYPGKEEYAEMVRRDCVLIRTGELLEILEDDDFQWVWAVFSAIAPKYSEEDILQFDLPYVKNVEKKGYNPHVDIPRMQHPYAELEIYAVDSSYMFMITDDDELTGQFKKAYPLYSEE